MLVEFVSSQLRKELNVNNDVVKPVEQDGQWYADESEYDDATVDANEKQMD